VNVCLHIWRQNKLGQTARRRSKQKETKRCRTSSWPLAPARKRQPDSVYKKLFGKICVHPEPSTPRGDRPLCSVPLSGTYPTEPENAERDDVSPLPVRASANRDIRKGFWWTACDVSNYGRRASTFDVSNYGGGSPTGLAQARGACKRLRSCKV
jgi:hypothetical protein